MLHRPLARDYECDPAMSEALIRWAANRAGRGDGFATASVVDPFGNVLGVMTNPHYLEILAGAGPR